MQCTVNNLHYLGPILLISKNAMHAWVLWGYNVGFYHPDSEMTLDLLPRPGLNPKIVKFMAPTQLYSDQTKPKHFIINPNFPVWYLNTSWNEAIGPNILQHDSLYLLSLGMRGMVSI